MKLECTLQMNDYERETNLKMQQNGVHKPMTSEKRIKRRAMIGRWLKDE